MAKISGEYISTLVDDAIKGDSNAFAVLFVSTYQDLYDKCFRYLKNEYDTQDVIFSTYVLAYRDLVGIRKTSLFFEWLDTIGVGQLKRILQKRGTFVPTFVLRKKYRKHKYTMSLDIAGQLLESIFFELGVKPNDVPLETLADYHAYRTSRFTFQWVIIAIILLFFMLFPLYFITPKFTLVMDNAKSSPKEAIYMAKIDGFLPVRTVIADLNGNPASVMLDDDRLYSVAASKNGKLEVTVTLMNGKAATLEETVTTIDTEKPVIDAYYAKDGNLILKVSDEGYGVDFGSISAVEVQSGTSISPLSYNESDGTVVFPYPQNEIEVSISDKADNSLRVLIGVN